MPDSDFSNEQLARYSRHILLPEIDIEGQQRISRSRIAIIGAGGLGSPAALYLAASGIGQLSIIDHDEVDLGNLQRQIAYTINDLGSKKSQTLVKALHQLNPDIALRASNDYATQATLSSLAKEHDLIIDASDNFETRFAINEACQHSQTPLISGAAIRFEGQVCVFDPTTPESACYHCIYNKESEDPHESCSDRGIFSPLTGIIGSIQAAEALKFITGAGTTLMNRLLSVDAMTMQFRLTKVAKDPKCPTCSGR